MDNSKYVKYVNSHEDEIAKYVNDCFEASKDVIRTTLMREIREYITPIPYHYDWQYDENPYDFSGEIVRNGYISLDQTIASFFEDEYTGDREATYISRMGFRYMTYGDELSYVTMQMASDIMFSAIKECIENQFNISLSDEELEDIRDNCRSFDPIYDECLASDFFFYESAINFVGIGNIKLTELLQ